MKIPGGLNSLLKLFSSAIVNQALLSAANLAAGIWLVRYTEDREYGEYVLVWNSLLLLTSMQTAFIAPPISRTMACADERSQVSFTANLARVQLRFYLFVAAALALILLGLTLPGWIDRHWGLLGLAATGAGFTALLRENLRTVLNAYRRPELVLWGDLAYVGLLLPGVVLACRWTSPSIAAVLSISIAAAAGYGLLLYLLRSRYRWRPDHRPVDLKRLQRDGSWSVAGAGIHWSFGQGYAFLVAAVLGVDAVAAIAATRLLLMPLNLISTGVRSLMLPLSSSWLHHHGSGELMRRLVRIALSLAALALVYAGLVWLLRDWIFGQILHKQFEARDPLILLWSAIFFVSIIRDQLAYLLMSRQRYQRLAGLTFACAVLSLGCSYFGMLGFGLEGALLGMLLGEIASLAGILALSVRELETPSWRPA